MRKLIVGGALAAALAMPTAASAQDPNPADFKNASKHCKALKKHSGAGNFAQMFGGKKNAHGKCVSRTAKQNAREDAQQEKEARKNASQQCREERGDSQESRDAFNQKYGSNKNGKNAFGKCVSKQAKANKAEADREDKAEDKAKLNAAKKCKTARKDDADAFGQKYGTKRNAFGKCVSQTARGGGENEQAGEQS